jgi:signal transduction histidine kinase
VLQAERLAAVGELAAGVAHEVNNPVNFALNALRTLSSQVEALAELARALSALDPSDPAALARQVRELEHLRGGLAPQEAADELQELVAIVTEGLERTYRLVGNLRDLAGPGRGARLPVDLRRGIESTLQLLGRDLEQAGVTVRTDLGGEPLVVQGDAGALGQVFLNLLKNSAEAFEGRRGTVWIEARREGAWVELAIRDDGPGIPAQVRGRLFEPFFTTKEAGRGSGLGLSICRRIVMEHGGTIELSSPPGGHVGAAFAIRLPLEGAEPTHAA